MTRPELGAWWHRLSRDRAQFPLISAERLRALRHRWHRVLVLALVVGIIVGFAVSGFDWIAAHVLLARVTALPEAAQIIIPGAGLIVATILLRSLAHTTSSISDDYLRAYHERPRDTGLRTVVARLVASVVTLGSGAAMGFEGPAIYLGSTIGSRFQQRFHRFFSDRDRHILLVAGAAAAVAAIFKAPATGAVFALEVPYQQDTASHAVLPALIASASSYITYVTFYGTGRLFTIAGTPVFNARDLIGAAVLGIACGFGARGFAWMLRSAKHLHSRHPRLTSLSAAAAIIAIGAIAFALFSHGLTIGPGYNAIRWSLDPGRSTTLVAALLVLHAFATVCAVGGGGAGGLFIPLVVEGWLLGRCAEGILDTRTALFPVIGAAAFLGAGYRTPIAAVVFVAETTGRPGFIVPALIATAVAQLVMGQQSVTDQQLQTRVGALDRRLDQPVSFAMEATGPTCTSGTALSIVRSTMADGDSIIVVVVDDDMYRGTIDMQSIGTMGSRGHAADAIDAAYPVVVDDAPLREALAVMQRERKETLPVVDSQERLVGVLRASAVLGDVSTLDDA